MKVKVEGTYRKSEYEIPKYDSTEMITEAIIQAIVSALAFEGHDPKIVIQSIFEYAEEEKHLRNKDCSR